MIEQIWKCRFAITKVFGLGVFVLLTTARDGVSEDMNITSRFTLSKSRYIVGEPIRLMFTLRNDSENTITFSVLPGGGKGAFNFSLESGSDSVENTEPYPEGGFGRNEVVLSNRAYENTVFLNRFLLFKSSGKYMINCKIDLSVASLSTGKSLGEVRARDQVSLEIVAASASDLTNVVRELEREIDSGDVKRQREAVEALSLVKSPLAVAGLGRAMKIADGIVQYHAVNGLGEIGTTEAIEALIAVMNLKDTGARQTAIAKLAELKASRAIPAMLKALEDKNARIRLGALRAIAVFGDTTCVDALEAKLGDSDEDVRKETAKVLSLLKKRETAH